MTDYASIEDPKTIVMTPFKAAETPIIPLSTSSSAFTIIANSV